MRASAGTGSWTLECARVWKVRAPMLRRVFRSPALTLRSSRPVILSVGAPSARSSFGRLTGMPRRTRYRPHPTGSEAHRWHGRPRQAHHLGACELVSSCLVYSVLLRLIWVSLLVASSVFRFKTTSLTWCKRGNAPSALRSVLMVLGVDILKGSLAAFPRTRCTAGPRSFSAWTPTDDSPMGLSECSGMRSLR